MHRRWFAVYFDDFYDAHEDVENLLEAGDHVVLVQDLDQLADVLDVDLDDLELEVVE